MVPNLLLAAFVALCAALTLSPAAPAVGWCVLGAQQWLARRGRFGPAVAGVASGLGAAGALAVILPVGVSGAVGVAVSSALVGAALLTVDRKIMTEQSAFWTTLFLPAINAAVEAAAVEANPFGSWGLLSTTLAATPALAAPAAVGGLPLLAFLVAWPGSALVWAAQQPSERRRLAWIAPAAVALAIGASSVLGPSTDGEGDVPVALMRPADAAAAPVQTALREAAATGDWSSLIAASTPANVDVLRRTRDAVASGTRLIVWSEGAAIVPSLDESTFTLALRRAAFGATVAMGVVVFDPGADRPLRNELWWVGPTGEIAVRQAKARPVPGWEADHMAGGEPPTPFVDPDLGRLAGVVCFDADFPGISASVGRGARLLAVPANDWPEIARLHADMARLRAIELGVPVLRAADHGVLSIFDARGRVIAESTGDTLLGRIALPSAPP